MSGKFIIRNADGRALGQYDLGGPMEPVPDGMASVFRSEDEARMFALDFPGAVVEPLR